MKRVALALLLTACGGSSTPVPTGPRVVEASEIEWEALNPARGDRSPRAANLWGDRTTGGASGFLVRFADGFSSPPHIHNVSYRAVVIDGRVHNADPAAEERWLPPGSFWTQPRGGAHITAARGDTIAYVEIDEGPYLVHPAEQAFDTDERPVELEPSELAWTAGPAGSQVARLWGEPSGPRGVLVRLPVGAAMRPTGDDVIRAVVIVGRVKAGGATLEPGAYVAPDGATRLTCGDDPCTLYLRSEGRLDLAAP